MSSSRDFFEILGIICVSFIIFIWGVAGQEVVGFDSRFYLFALEMWRHGPTWFPTTYSQPYPDYPATSTFIIYVIAKFMGHLDKLASILPTAFLGAVTVGITYMIGALHNKRWGLYAALLLLFTMAYLKAGRSISLDMYSTFITAWCFYIVYSADVKDKHGREWFIYPLFFLGFAFRGPIGLIIPTGVVCVYYLLDLNIKNFFFTAMLSLFVLVLSSFMLLGLAAWTGGEVFLNKVLMMEAFGRMNGGHLPFYYYIVHAMDDYAISLPLAAFVALGTLYYRYRLHAFTPDMQLLMKMIGWVVVILVGMSIPGDKKIRYVLPIAPALALLAAYPFVCNHRDRYFSMLYSVFLYFFAFVPLFFIMLLFILSRVYSEKITGLNLHYSWMTPLLLTMLSLNVTALFKLAKKPHLRDTAILVLATFSFVIVYINIVEVVEYYIDRTRETVVIVETERLNANAQLVFYQLHPDGLPIKYLVNMWQDDQPIFIDKQVALAALTHPAYVVTTQKIYNALPSVITAKYQVVFMDRLGHVPVVIFTNTNQ